MPKIVESYMKPGAEQIATTFQQPDLTSIQRGLASWTDSDAVKRGFDVCAASVLLVFFLPVLLLIAVSLKLFSRGPVLFAHHRVGRGGKLFPCLKFRTMQVNAKSLLAAHLEAHPECRAEWEQTNKLKNDPRILPIGHILRKSSLDELPQLINVLRGEMSLVGPRPIVTDEAVHYGNNFQHYLAMRPGISGLWQVSGRNDTTYAERVALDVTYASTRSLVGDMGILLRTVGVVLWRRGAY